MTSDLAGLASRPPRRSRPPRPARRAGSSPADRLRTLRTMVEIPSITGSEGKLACYLAERMAALGYAARVDAAGNAIGEIGDPDGATVMLLGHIDTVPGQIPVRRVGNLLYGRGSVDAKGAIAAMMHAGAQAAPRACSRIVLVGAVGEEGASPGAYHLLGSPPPDALVIGEPSGARQVVIGYKGLVCFRYLVTRPPHHTSGPVENAVEVAADAWAAVRDRLAAQYPAAGPVFGRAVAALVRLDGDTQTAAADISCRIPAGFDTDAFVGWLRGRLGDGAVRVTESVPAVRITRTDPVVRALAAAIRRHGGEPVMKVKLGTSDLNVVQPSWAVPAAVYGPGDSRLDHTADEHIDLREYLLATDVLSSALPDIAKAAASHRERGQTR